MKERREVVALAAVAMLLTLCLAGCATYSNDGQPSTTGTSTSQEPAQQPMQADTTSMSEPAASPDTSSMPH
jgi:outer membrane protein assembly factor BamE (lipoprotein component of BamABCDE complex)